MKAPSPATERHQRQTLYLAGLACCLALPGTAQVQKYFGLVGVGVYLPLVFLAVFAGYRHLLAVLDKLVKDRWADWLAVGALCILLVLFAFVYPIANVNTPGAGSDGDDAIELAAGQLLSGKYPYYPRTYLDNPISPLPGAVFLSVPFVLLGVGALQNLVWLVALYLVLRREVPHARDVLWLLGVALVLCPAIPAALMVGQDILSNSIYVLGAALLVMRWWTSEKRVWWRQLFAAIALGVALSSRINFVLALPPVFACVGHRVGWRRAAICAAIAGSAFLAITLPFYLYDPAGFSPLHTLGILGKYDAVVPYSSVATVLLAGGLGLWLSRRPLDEARSFRIAALALAVPVVSATILLSVSVGRPSSSVARYGGTLVFFGAVGCWLPLRGRVEGKRAAAPVPARALVSRAVATARRSAFVTDSDWTIGDRRRAVSRADGLPGQPVLPLVNVLSGPRRLSLFGDDECLIGVRPSGLPEPSPESPP